MSADQGLGNAIAVIGMGGRFPGARDLEAFWDLLREGRDGLAVLDAADPWMLQEPDASWGPVRLVPRRPILEGSTEFDPAFFRYSPREAAVIDPQQRVFLQCAWEAFETAGIDPARFDGWIGVWAGCDLNTYLPTRELRYPDFLEGPEGMQAFVSTDKDYLATRIAYKLDLRGPAITVQSACSTSLVAVQQACQALLVGQCDIALAGGVAISFPGRRGYHHFEGGATSPDGYCRPFDHRANGTVFGDGAGAVLLRPLADALAAGDPVLAVLRAVALNNDGSAKAGFSAPGIAGQHDVIATAIALAGVDSNSISYVEAHGTGTPLGDPIEFDALRRAYGDVGSVISLGSVKSNIGHASTASGMAALLKTIQMLRHRQIPPTIHFEKVNPRVEMDGSRFAVATDLRDWIGAGPCRAGISNFGIGGTNAHAIVEEAPANAEASEMSDPRTKGPHLLLVSAGSSPSANESARRVARYLEAHPDVDLSDAAYTLRHGRRPLAQRLAICAPDRAAAIQGLLDEGPGLRSRGASQPGRRPVFLFSGQGTQFPGMTAGLCRMHSAFRARIEECADLLLRRTRIDLLSILCPEVGREEDAGRRLSDPIVAQPALLAVEYATASLWESCGVRAVALAGHSLGELAAATFAGVFELGDALWLSAERGRLMGSVPQGAMLSVALPEDELRRILPAALDLASLNAPGACLVSGTPADIDRLRSSLEGRGIECRALHINVAGHSRLMAEILPEFRSAVASLRLREPLRPLLSNRTGGWLSVNDATDPDYWADHLRNPVRFSDNARLLLEDSSSIFVEVGPGRSLCNLMRQNAAQGREVVTVQSLRHPLDEHDDLAALLYAAGQLWTRGCEPDWSRLLPDSAGRRVYLPPRAFERVVCELPQRKSVGAEEPTGRRAPSLAKRPLQDGWLHLPQWTSAPLLAKPDRVRDVLVHGPAETAERLAAALGELGSAVTVFGSFPDPCSMLGQLPEDAIVVSLEGIQPWNVEEPLEEYHRFAEWSGRLAEHAIRPFEWIAMTCGASPLDPAHGPEPEKALLLGVLRSLDCENPCIQVRHLECDGLADDRAARAAAREILGASRERHIVLSAGRRWIPRLERLPAKHAAPPLRESGTYLVTGGFGGIGGSIARHLAGAYRARVVLVGRSAMPPREVWDALLEADSPDASSANVVSRIRFVRELETRGAEVHPASCDVADMRALSELRKDIRSRFGRLDGIVHAAGTMGGQILAARDRRTAEAVLQPKVVGSRALLEVFAEDRPDFIVFCSSLFAATGGAGQADYAAANAYLDALAARRSALKGTPCLSIAWDLWEDVGMATHLAASPGEGWEVVATRSYTGAEWELVEHRFAGRPTLPGTALTEWIVEEARRMHGGNAVELRSLEFRSMLVAETADPLELRLWARRASADGTWEFRVRSAAGGTGDAVAARIGAIGTGSMDWALPAWGMGETRQVEFPLHDLVNRTGTVCWGPRWDVVRDVRLDGSTLRARVELPHGLREPRARALHPALADAATALLAYFAEGDAALVPESCSRLAVFAPLPPAFQVEVLHIARSGEDCLEGRVRLATLEGEPLVEYDGYRLRILDEAGIARLARSGMRADGWRSGGIDGIRPDEGVQAFVQALSLLPESRIAVSLRDLDALDAAHRGARESGPGEPPGTEDAASGHGAFDDWSPTERILGEIWAKHLGIAGIGLHRNFFELGGHSLLAVQIQAEIRRRLGRSVPLSAFFKQPTIVQLAALLDASGTEEALELPPAPDAETYPTTDAQRRLYFLQRLDPQGTRYNNVFAFEFSPAMTADRVRAALTRLLEMHESLRTSFDWAEEGPRQRIEPAREFPFEEHRISLERSEDLLGKVRAFDLSKAPLARAHWFSGTESSTLLLEVHHIAADGISMEILTRQFIDLLRGQDVALDSSRFRDFAHWAAMRDADSDASRGYWLERFSGDIPVLNLSTDRPRGTSLSWPGGIFRFGLPAEVSRRLQEMGASRGGSLFMALLAAFQAFLARIAGQDDLVVGTPVAGRPHQGCRQTVGMFVQTLALRARPRPEIPFCSFLDEVVRDTIAAFEHQEYPFERLVSHLGIPRDPSRNPLFDVLLVLQEGSWDLPETDVRGAVVRTLPVGIPEAQIDLTLRVLHAGDGALECLFEYRADLFDASTIARWSRSFAVFLEALLDAPGAAIGDLELVDPADRGRIESWNATDAAFPAGTVVDLFEAIARARPEAEAAVFEGESLTYAELARRVDGLAARLRDEGVGPGSLVAVVLERGLEMPVALWGVLKAGGAYLPIDPRHPADRIRFILGDSGARWILTQSRMKEMLLGIGGGATILDLEDASTRECQGRIEAIAGPSDLAYCIYTSGSTGQPKGALIEHGALMNRIHWMQKHYPIGPGDTILQKTPYTFDVSVWEMFWWGMYGARVAYLRPEGEKDPEAILAASERHDVTVMHFVPSMLQAFLEYVEAAGAAPRMRKLRQVFASGEALLATHVAAFHRHLGGERGARLANLYGPTEATIDVSWFDCGERCPDPVPIGKPIDNIRLNIVSPRRRLQPIGVPGELWISGVGLARGYLSRPELTDEKFVDAPWDRGGRAYRTGDLARWREDGQIEYLGRMDFQVKIRGLRVEIGEIESCLLRMPGVREAAVQAIRGEEGGWILIAYTTGDVIDPEAARECLAAQLPDYMVPAAFVHLERLPISSNGKLDRRALPIPRQETMDADDGEPPSTPLENLVASIWEEVLGARPLSIRSHFFSLGGDSIQAIRVVARLRARGWAAEIADLFRHPALGAFAGSLRPVDVENATEMPAPFSLVPAVPGYRELLTSRADLEDAYPLTPVQEQVLAQNLASRRSGDDVQVLVLRFEGDIEADRFREAWRETMRIHPVLRSAIFWRRLPAPLQGVLRDPEPPLAMHDWSEADAAEIGRRLDALCAEARTTGFAYNRGLLWRLYAARIARREHLLVWAYQNSLFDGWSASVLGRDLLRIYEGLEGRNEARSSERTRPFSPYVGWLLARNEADDQPFWARHLAGVPAEESIAGAMPPEGRLGDVSFDLDGAAMRRLEDAARAAGITTAALVHGAWIACWASRSGAPTTLTAVASSGRPPELPGSESTAGLFTQVLPFAMPWAPEQGAWDWLREVQRRVVEMRRHEHVSIARIVEWNAAAKQAIQSAVQWKALVFRHSSEPAGSDADRRIVPIDAIGDVQVPLRGFVELGATLRFSLRHASATAEAFDVRALADRLASLLGAPPCADQTLSSWMRSVEEIADGR